MKKHTIHLLTSLLLVLCWAAPALAQSETGLTLSLTRDFGYSSGTGSIQGHFSMKVEGPAGLVKVNFFIDEQQIGEDSEAPFKLQFYTSDYALGTHTIYATAITQTGEELRSNEFRREFVLAEEGWKTAGKIAIPILAISFGAMLLSFVVPMLFGGRKGAALAPGSPRNYGLFGGTICPKCSRPFSVHLYGLNVGLGRLDRCPYCGKWSLVRRASLSDLRAAEEAEIETASTASNGAAVTEEEKLHKDLENSRYQDL